MEEIKVGELVRTKGGHFHQVTKIDNNGLVYWGNISCGWNLEQLKDIVKKHSFNIIDLIEIGDYVNGKYVETIKQYESGKSIIALIGIIDEKDIKSIVTKEQFKSVEYEV